MSHLIQVTRRPLSALEATKLRHQLLTQIEKEPRSCPVLAKRHKMHEKTMMNHLKVLADLGLIHSVKSPSGTRAPYMWVLGPGQSVKRVRATTPEAEQRQLRVTKWPAVTIPKQGIFAALGL